MPNVSLTHADDSHGAARDLIRLAVRSSGINLAVADIAGLLPAYCPWSAATERDPQQSGDVCLCTLMRVLSVDETS